MPNTVASGQRYFVMWVEPTVDREVAMVGYSSGGLREFLVRQSPRCGARWLVALRGALDAMAVTVLVGIAIRATVMGEDHAPEGMLGAAAGLACFQLVPFFRGRTWLALVRNVVLAVAAAAAFFALDTLLFPTLP